MIALDLGTVPQWITAINTGAVATALVTLAVQWWRRGISLKKLQSEEGLSLRRMQNEENSDLRDHYAQELTSLREKLDRQEDHFASLERHWREMMGNSDKRHEECEKARQSLRRELDVMHNERSEDRGKIDELQAEIAGLKRQIVSASAERVLRLEDAPHAAASAERVKKITGDE